MNKKNINDLSVFYKYMPYLFRQINIIIYIFMKLKIFKLYLNCNNNFMN